LHLLREVVLRVFGQALRLLLSARGELLP